MGLLSLLFAKNSSTDMNSTKKEEKGSYKECETELILRKEAGQEIEYWCIDESRNEGLPYDCFFEWELKMVEKAQNADNSLQGILDIISCARDYILHNQALQEASSLIEFNKNHAKVWINKLCSLATCGNIYAQAAIGGNYFDLKFPEMLDIFNECGSNDRETYRKNVESAAMRKNPEAMVAYAFFCLCDESQKEMREAINQAGGSLGSSEGYSQYFFSLENHWESKEGLEIAFKIAECDDGPTAYDFQDKLGDAYYYGDGWGLDVDKEKGLYWYERAAANGNESAISTLRRLRK